MNETVTVRHRQSGEDRTADLYDGVTADDFMESQVLWRPILLAACRILYLKRKPLPLYKHWDWRQKSSALNRLDVTFFGLRSANQLQGLMKADLGRLERCRLENQKGLELVYVDYVETAPWNIAEYMEALGREPLYSRVGVRLMQAAVKLSIDNELKGRVGLHSLPGAEDFYRKIGMTPISRDPSKENLLWFEFTPEAAEKFIRTYQ